MRLVGCALLSAVALGAASCAGENSQPSGGGEDTTDIAWSSAENPEGYDAAAILRYQVEYGICESVTVADIHRDYPSTRGMRLTDAAIEMEQESYSPAFAVAALDGCLDAINGRPSAYPEGP